MASASPGSLAARFDLSGRVAVVTGAASGLGRGFASALVEAGAWVACVDRDVEPLERTVSAMGDRTRAVVADLSREEDVAATLAEILAWRGGRIDILVNNAGMAVPPGRLLDVSVADWDRVIATNLRSVFLCTRAMLPAMIAGGGGSVINLSSFLGLVGAYPGFAVTAIPYSASKAAIDGFTRQLAVEYAREGIRANAIAPGWHGGTNLGRERRALASPEDSARFETFIERSVPMGHRGTAEDLTGLVLYLAGDASRYVTGQTLAHDGGLTAT